MCDEQPYWNTMSTNSVDTKPEHRIVGKSKRITHSMVYKRNLISQLQGDHSTCSKPPVDFKTKVPFWPVQAMTGQAKAEI